MSKASDEVLAERQRQIDAEGYDASHDDDHSPEDIVRAGLTYALLSLAHPDHRGDVSIGLNSGGVKINWKDHAKLLWPWVDGPKPKNMRRDLVRAAALLIAAVDRMDA